MRHLRSTIHVAAPPEDVFDLFADAKQIPRWYSPKIEVTDVTGRLTAPGASYTVVAPSADRTSGLRWMAVRVDRPRVLELSTTDGAAATIVVRFESATGGTNVILEADSELPLDLEPEQSLRDFKALVEAETFVYN